MKPLTILQVTVFLTRVGGGVFGNSDDWINKGDPRAAARAVLAAASLAFRAASDNLTRDSYLFVSRSHREGTP